MERAKAYTTDPSAPKKHHFVPRSYLARFAVNGQVRRTLVDTGQQRNLGLKGVGYLEDFYRLEAPDIDPDRTPPLFTEVLLGALEDDAKRDIDTLLLYEPGIITNSSMITDMSFYLAAQHVRGRAFREEQEVLIQWSDIQDPIELSTILARFHLVLTGGNPDDEALVAARAEQIRSTQPISADLKAQALQLMLQQWFPLVLTFAGLKWAIYHTEAPLLTSDEPVVLIGTPGTDRTEKPGLLTTGVVVFPMSNDQNLWIPGGRTFPEDDLQGIGILIKTSVGALAGRHARAHGSTRRPGPERDRFVALVARRDRPRRCPADARRGPARRGRRLYRPTCR